MVKLSFHNYYSGAPPVKVEWPVAPRIGDYVDLNDDPDGLSVGPNVLSGRVVKVIWWRDGSALVELNDEQDPGPVARDEKKGGR